MFTWLISISLRHAKAVVIVAGILLALAGWLIPRMAVDVFPELNAPTVVVMTEAGGLAADEVEQYVTVPIESAVNGMPGMRKLRSSSSLGLSIVWAEFDWGEDIWRARQQVAERLSAVEAGLPPGAHAEIAPVTSITGEVMLLSVTSPDGTRTPKELRSFAEFELTNRLLGVAGIAQVVAIGGELPEYQVLCRPDRLQIYGLTVADVVEAAQKAHSTASAGFLPNREGKEVPIRQTAQVTRAEDVQRTVIAYHEGVPVTIGDVAEVALAPAPARGTATERGRSAVIISVQKAPGTNTLTLTTALDQAVASMAVPSGMVVNNHVFRQAEFIQVAVDNLIKVLTEAAIIVSVVLILFLLNVRTTLITLTALPLSLGAAFIVMSWWGLSINVMTLGGLAVALGGLVDDAIIYVENAFRRLRENRHAPEGQRLDEPAVVERSSHEIAGPMVFATIIIVLVFIPLLFLGGMEGRFFRPLGISYIVSTLASLLIAVTVTPALCRMLLTGLKHAGEERDSFLVRWLKDSYRPTLAFCIRWKKSVVLGSAALAIAALALATTFGSSFLPSFKEGTFTVMIMTPPGTSLIESDRLVRGVEERIAAIPGVRDVARRTGRAERDQHAEPPSTSEMNVTMEPGTQDRVQAELDRILAQMPGVVTSIGQPIEHRLSHILSGTPAAVSITVFGDDLDQLRTVVKEIEAGVKGIAGARDVVANREIMIETLPVRYRHEDLARAGLSPAEAAEQVEQAIAGVHVATVNQGIRRYDLTVRLHPDERQTEEQIGELVLKSPHGPQVRLREVAEIGLEKASNLIAREGARRKAVVSCNVAEGQNLGDLVVAIRGAVDPIVAKAGLSVHYGGQFEAQQEASRSIGLMGIAVVAVVFLLLAAALSSAKAAGLVMLNLPLSLIGGIGAVYLAESPSVAGNTLALIGLGGAYTAPVLSIASLVGFITLFGIAVRNGILLINQYQSHAEDGRPLQQAIMHGSEERLVAILMTALCAAIGLIPLALMAGQPGAEILAPLAIVVLGGLVSSTALNLVVVPAAYAWVFATTPPADHQQPQNPKEIP
ncbi:MAG: efflux RND transporter permease subunit [Planctomycetes bacterium]|nr:efflux RND transporter permease subunit [Planctomycetota bacterium]